MEQAAESSERSKMVVNCHRNWKYEKGGGRWRPWGSFRNKLSFELFCPKLYPHLILSVEVIIVVLVVHYIGQQQKITVTADSILVLMYSVDS
jgi:hypothetical protein